MTEETTGEWQTCVVDDEYEIYDQYPYPIRRKGSDRIIKESLCRSTGYMRSSLNRKGYDKHRIIAQQFIPNPNNLPCIDHKNRNRTDNRLENLRFVSYAENAKNKSSSHNGINYEFFDEIPCESQEDIIEVRDYNGHEFEDLYFIDDFFYFWNGVQYKRLHICHDKIGCLFVNAYDVESKRCQIYYTKFKRLYGLD